MRACAPRIRSPPSLARLAGSGLRGPGPSRRACSRKGRPSLSPPGRRAVPARAGRPRTRLPGARPPGRPFPAQPPRLGSRGPPSSLHRVLRSESRSQPGGGRPGDRRAVHITSAAPRLSCTFSCILRWCLVTRCPPSCTASPCSAAARPSPGGPPTQRRTQTQSPLTLCLGPHPAGRSSGSLLPRPTLRF